jgi:hypothetical protein
MSALGTHNTFSASQGEEEKDRREERKGRDAEDRDRRSHSRDRDRERDRTARKPLRMAASKSARVPLKMTKNLSGETDSSSEYASLNLFLLSSWLQGSRI